jgi:hypothetical protein
LLGLGWPEWLLILGLVGGLLITFKVMARASVAYAKAREMREARAWEEGSDKQDPGGSRNEDREG